METQSFKRLLIPYAQAVEELKLKFKTIRQERLSLDEYSPIEFVTGRVKRISSILEKAKKKDIPLSQIEEKIEDIAGIRIMCQFVEDIHTVTSLIRCRHGKDLEVVEERDYITNIKPSGYRSYHIIIKYPVQTAEGEKVVLAEIQIRTLAMNFWATIEHSLRYKYKQNMPEHIQERLNKSAHAAYQLDMEMAEIREEVLKAQDHNLEETNVVACIFTNIQLVAKQMGEHNMAATYERFWDLWERNEILKLQEFNVELEEMLKNEFV
ncbi:MAG: GTP pyrophosphokinase [Epulopiscium sp. Nele67-Bin004]|nr:MAG: GTP pyrophosphokinase [Epulopiscium sp. Nele67-Bin004]